MFPVFKANEKPLNVQDLRCKMTGITCPTSYFERKTCSPTALQETPHKRSAQTQQRRSSLLRPRSRMPAKGKKHLVCEITDISGEGNRRFSDQRNHNIFYARKKLERHAHLCREVHAMAKMVTIRQNPLSFQK